MIPLILLGHEVNTGRVLAYDLVIVSNASETQFRHLEVMLLHQQTQSQDPSRDWALGQGQVLLCMKWTSLFDSRMFRNAKQKAFATIMRRGKKGDMIR